MEYTINATISPLVTGDIIMSITTKHDDHHVRLGSYTVHSELQIVSISKQEIKDMIKQLKEAYKQYDKKLKRAQQIAKEEGFILVNSKGYNINEL